MRRACHRSDAAGPGQRTRASAEPLLRALRRAAARVATGSVLLGTAAAAQQPEAAEPFVASDSGTQWGGAYVTAEDLTEVYDGDARITILQSPIFHFEGREIHATWCLIWIDRDAPSFWSEGNPDDLRVGAVASVDEPESGPVAATGFGELLQRPELSPVRELYLEGPVEFYEKGQRVASAEALYVDRIEGHGWLSDGRIHVREKVGGSRFVFKVQADWLRISSDGSLRSDRARITTCEHEDPHYFLRTDELRMTPTGDPEYPWRVSLKGNRLRIADTVTLPLPPINYLADEDGEPALRNLRVGDSARYGPTVGVGYARDLRDFGRGVNELLSGDPDNFRAKFRVDASYLGSRGLLLDLGLKLRSEGHYKIDTYFGLIPDGDEDRGLVRVDEDDRDTLRTWLRTRGRFNVSEGAWVDVVVSDQTDPGVQSEFFEDDYLQFEERESYIHWRKAWDANYASATASTVLDEWRTDVEELPELRYARQRTTIANLGGLPLVWGGQASGGWYQRQDGDPEFEQPFSDGLGEREFWRADASTQLELPIALGTGAVRLIPFADLRGTTWSEAVDAGTSIGDDASRSALVTGAKLTTTLWRRSRAGSLVEFAPTVGISRSSAYDTSGGEPIPIDAVDEDFEGTFLDVGLRARVQLAGYPFDFDAEVTTRRQLEVPGTPAITWTPINVFAAVDTQIGSVPIRVTHDGRYDPESNRTDYARTKLSFEPIEDLEVDATITVGRDDVIVPPGVLVTDQIIVEAAGIGALYRFSPKWEFEAQQTINLVSSEALASRGIIRRYGHDLIVEYFVSRRSGEGGTSFGISLKPAITANRRPPVLLPSSDFGD